MTPDEPAAPPEPQDEDIVHDEPQTDRSDVTLTTDDDAQRDDLPVRFTNS